MSNCYLHLCVISVQVQEMRSPSLIVACINFLKCSEEGLPDSSVAPVLTVPPLHELQSRDGGHLAQGCGFPSTHRLLRLPVLGQVGLDCYEE